VEPVLPEPGMFRWREARVPVRVMRSRKVSGLHIWGYRSRNCWARGGAGWREVQGGPCDRRGRRSRVRARM